MNMHPPTSPALPDATSRRTVLSSAAIGAVVGLGTRIGTAGAQEATPAAITDAASVPGTAATFFSVVAQDLPAAPVEITLARAVSQPGDGDLEDYFTFPGPLAFVIESGVIICRCGTDESPCTILRADGTTEAAPPVPADISLGPGEGLFIPANTPDSFIVEGAEPVVELDVSIFPAAELAGTPTG